MHSGRPASCAIAYSLRDALQHMWCDGARSSVEGLHKDAPLYTKLQPLSLLPHSTGNTNPWHMHYRSDSSTATWSTTCTTCLAIVPGKRDVSFTPKYLPCHSCWSQRAPWRKLGWAGAVQSHAAAAHTCRTPHAGLGSPAQNYWVHDKLSQQGYAHCMAQPLQEAITCCTVSAALVSAARLTDVSLD